MTKRNRIYLLWVFTLLLAIGIWLTGNLGIEVHLGSHVYGRRIGFDERETYDSLLGWGMIAVSLAGQFIIMYRSR